MSKAHTKEYIYKNAASPILKRKEQQANRASQHAIVIGSAPN